MSEQNLSARLQESMGVLAERSLQDDAFRQQLLSTPRKLLSLALGEPIPSSVAVMAHENSEQEWHIVLDPTMLPQLAQLPDQGGPIGQALLRAHKDPAFRKTLRETPRQAFLEAAGINLPSDMTVAVHENTPNEVHLVVPARPSPNPDGELSDADLEAVAGGLTFRVSVFSSLLSFGLNVGYGRPGGLGPIVGPPRPPKDDFFLFRGF